MCSMCRGIGQNASFYSYLFSACDNFLHYLILSRPEIVNPHKSSMVFFLQHCCVDFSLLSCSGPCRITGRDVMRMFCRIPTEKLFSWGVIGKKTEDKFQCKRCGMEVKNT